MTSADLDLALRDASSDVGLLWPLEGAIAANPLHDAIEEPFAQVVSRCERRLGHDLWPKGEHLREAGRRGLSIHAPASPHDAALDRPPTIGERGWSRGSDILTRLVGVALRELVTRDRAAGSDFDQQLAELVTSSWSWMPVPKSMKPVLRELGSTGDFSHVLEIAPGWTTAQVTEEYARHFARLPGWAAWAKWNDEWATVAHHHALSRREFLTVSILLDRAWLEAHGGELIEPTPRALDSRNASGLERLEVLEGAVHGELLAKLGGAATPSPAQPTVQVATCIDVRSEPLRRALERNAEVETIGFAGFFGVFATVQRTGEIEAYQSLPVLVPSSATIVGGPQLRPRKREQLAVGATVAELTHEPPAMFAVAEASGFLALPWLLAQGIAPGRGRSSGVDPGHWTLSLDDAVALAEGALRGMGLTGPFGEEVLLLGHEARSANNPHHAALECGACAGHSGAPNASVLAELLNDLAVRRELANRGIDVPTTTRFIAGVHHTTTEDVEVFGPCSPHLRQLLDEATREVAAWRADLAGEVSSQAMRALTRRSNDWSEVRPEWGLANHAAFYVGPRSSLRGVDLGGRVFLHSYDASADGEGAQLRTILSAPVVVAQWINASYYFSTVAPHLLGAGDKTLHNPVGDFAVLEGDGPDLCLGLPLQSLTIGDRPLHLPVRLLVAVEAPEPLIARVISTTPIVEQLVNGEWIRLVHRSAAGEPWRYWATSGAPVKTEVRERTA